MNEKDTGYRGIWYMNQPTKDEYVFCDKAGQVYRLPRAMTNDFEKPQPLFAEGAAESAGPGDGLKRAALDL